VTDLGIARVWRPDNSTDTSGTPGNMAPEVMCRQNHGIAVDYYALGVIVYECMIGKRPYVGRDRKEIRDQILAKQVQLKRSDIPEGWSVEAADFINRLIQRKPVNRLGMNGPQELKSHPWFKDYPWEKLNNKELQSPFLINEAEMNAKQGISNSNWDDENSEVLKQNAILLRRNSIQGLFNGYQYDATVIPTIQPLSNDRSGKTSARQSFASSPFTNSFANQTTQLLSGIEQH